MNNYVPPVYRFLIPIKKCARCGYNACKTKLHVHHIDYNHEHNQRSNLIVLCRDCHMRLHWRQWKLSDITRQIYNEAEDLTEDDITLTTNPQKEALTQIKKLNDFEPKRWFTQMELFKVTLHTLRALEEKEYLETKEFPAMKLKFYQYTEKELE